MWITFKRKIGAIYARWKPSGTVRILESGGMATIDAEDVRIPRHVREAVTRHERVVVLNRERPVLAIVHPDDLRSGAGEHARQGQAAENLIGRRLAECLGPDEQAGLDVVEVG